MLSSWWRLVRIFVRSVVVGRVVILGWWVLLVRMVIVMWLLGVWFGKRLEEKSVLRIFLFLRVGMRVLNLLSGCVICLW